MRVVRTASELRRTVGPGSVFVPTMGALHEGHASLIGIAGEEVARRGGPGCVVSIFVNPAQFNEASDFAAYPRTLDADLAVCEREGVAAVFVPDEREVYPRGLSDAPVELPSVATEPGLEDRRRPGHFAGVCRVVARLFEMVEPGAAVFGEKDWQQLQVVRAMVRDLGMGVEIVGAPTVRDADGLAMSSRNALLGASGRDGALSLVRALRGAGGRDAPLDAELAMRSVLEGAGVGMEYAVVRDAETLGPPDASRTCRALVAARVGGVRLIDNAPWPGDALGPR